MMDIHIRKDGYAGRITLHRPKALNALTYQMCLDIEVALDAWRDDDAVKLVIIDAEGDKAFCAGGDIQDLYDASVGGDFAYGQTFWRDEYRLNAKIFNYSKPYVALMQGFVMGGGVGVSCHGSHRIVCESSQIAMPECGIGLIPDVGGSLMLARAPGRLGEYLGTTGARMDAGNAIYAGFADSYVLKEKWDALTAALVNGGDVSVVDGFVQDATEPSMRAQQSDIDHHFDAVDLNVVAGSLASESSEFAAQTLKMISKKSPLSVAATPALIARVRGVDTIEQALAEEYKFTFRAAEFGDFIEGIKATIIDRSHAPNWRFATLADVGQIDVNEMLAPLGANAL
ncbi:MAG: 3-hydroxyisobutyryl-CoA hydrolase [Amylibacter sp.]